MESLKLILSAVVEELKLEVVLQEPSQEEQQMELLVLEEMAVPMSMPGDQAVEAVDILVVVVELPQLTMDLVIQQAEAVVLHILVELPMESRIRGQMKVME